MASQGHVLSSMPFSYRWHMLVCLLGPGEKKKGFHNEHQMQEQSSMQQ